MNRSIHALLIAATVGVGTMGFGVALAESEEQLKANMGNPTQPVTPAH